MTEPVITVFVKENTQTYLAGRIKPDFNCVGDVVLAISNRPVFQGRALYLTRLNNDEQLDENVALSTLPPQTGPTGLEVTLQVRTGPAVVAVAAAGAADVNGDVDRLAESVAQKLMPKVKEAIAEAKRPITEAMETVCAASVVSLLDEHDSGIGCAIFISNTVAVTCHHNIQGYETQPIHGLMEDGSRVSFRVRPSTDEDVAMDVAALDIDTDGRTSRHYLVLSSSPLRRGLEVAVLSFQSKIKEDLEDSFGVSVGFVKASVYKASSRHVLLQAPTFRGDSGAAVVLQDGKLVAMNVAGVNAAKERLQQLDLIASGTKLQRRLEAVEKSVDSLVGDLAQGSIAVLASTFAHFVAATDGPAAGGGSTSGQ